MERKNVAVIFGGCSSEYDVSLQSASAVIQNLPTSLYHIIMLGITRHGQWYRYRGTVNKIAEDTWCNSNDCVEAFISPCRNQKSLIEFYDDKFASTKIDVVFPVLHGRYGEDGALQGLLEMANIPYVGCGVLSSAICMDKDFAHKMVAEAGYLTPKSAALWKNDWKGLQEKIQEFRFPLFVKPARAGSSMGISRVAVQAELKQALRKAWEYDEKAVLEEAVQGVEVGCAIVGNRELTIGEIDEIELAQAFFDYNEKYSEQAESQILMPARISAAKAEEIKATAAQIYRILECRGMARIDFFFTPDGVIYFNEVNTIPGFTSHSRFPTMLKGAGLAFKDVLQLLIQQAME